MKELAALESGVHFVTEFIEDSDTTGENDITVSPSDVWGGWGNGRMF